MRTGGFLAILLLVAGLGGGVPLHAKVAEDVTGSLKTLTSIGDALDSPDHHPVHILYVHGINAIGAGDSSLLRQSICTRLNLCQVSDWMNAGTEFADKREFANGSSPPLLNYLGHAIWTDKDEWHAAAPFVVHWVIHLRNHPSVLIVDEVNWWPLVLALKCRNMVNSEAYLAGPNVSLLQVCSTQQKQDPGAEGRFYPWLSETEANELAKKPAHAVLINRELKNGLLDWGFSDAMLAVGPLGRLMRDGVRQLIVKSVEFDPNGTGTTAPGAQKRRSYNWQEHLDSGRRLDQEFIGVTHSLGSYLLFNTLSLESDIPPVASASNAATSSAQEDRTENALEDNAVAYVFQRTSLIYFFANQLSLLEFTNLEGPPAAASAANSTAQSAAAQPSGTQPAPRFEQMVNRWAQYQSQFQSSVHAGDEAARKKVQVVAWSDPSDLLTWRVPRIGEVDVLNFYVQNATHWFWLFESPTGAHDGYAKNKIVLRHMFLNPAHKDVQ
jgi:hypothetical protein